MCKWLHDTLELDDVKQNRIQCCINGHLEIYKWLCEEYPWHRTSSELLGNRLWSKENYEFSETCINGHLEMCKYLYSINPNVININKMDIIGVKPIKKCFTDMEYIFYQTCENGHYDVIEWLLSIIAIDISIYKNSMLRASCRNGHLKLSKLLYSIKSIVITSTLFNKCIINGHIEMCFMEPQISIKTLVVGILKKLQLLMN
jgi:hypothetical protein